ncbi:MAG: DUF3387 domain-containing protein, partial [Planctomycetes bacterium]|nr:DUF3387 domain-containing protein [Planctomycetota bacterium]
PVLRKAELISRLRKAVEEATAFCDSLRVDFSKMVGLEALERVKFLDDAVEAILVNDETKSRYMALARQVDELFRAALPDRAANDFHQTRTLLLVLADKIRTLEPATDVSAVMERVGHLLDESVAAEGYVIPAGAEGRYVDLSQFDFDALKAKFEKGRRRVEAERLRRLLEGKVSEMVRLNKSRVNYHEKLQRMIDEYNSGSLNVETFFRNLVAFSRELAEEDQRAIKAQLTEEELALFDLLTKPDMKLNKSEEQAVKKVAKELLAALKRGTLALDWRKRQQSRAAVRLCIEETLERLPAIYVRDAYQRKCDALFQHIYDCYYGEGRGVYAVPA